MGIETEWLSTRVGNARRNLGSDHVTGTQSDKSHDCA